MKKKGEKGPRKRADGKTQGAAKPAKKIRGELDGKQMDEVAGGTGRSYVGGNF